MDTMKSTSEQWLGMVSKFHAAFDHPIAGPGGNILSESRRAARGAWLIEELMEFTAAESLVDQVDACLDFLYFCWGTFVELGSLPVGLNAEFPAKKVMLPSEIDFPYRVSFSARAAASVFEFMHSDTLRGQRDFTADAARIVIRTMKALNADPVGLMEIVQDSNMGKLHPDGKPHYGDLGKVIKPEHWEAPEKRLEDELHERIAQWNKEIGDDIPF